MEKGRLRDALCAIGAAAPEAGAAALGPAAPPGNPGPPAAKALPPYLAKFGKDLSAAAEAGRLDPLIGRGAEVRLLAQALAQRKKNAPILVGDPGVGKTCIVEGLAREIASGGVSELLAGLRIVSLDMASMVAGTKHRGEFEERLEGVLAEAKADPNLVLFIDEIHTLVGAGGGESQDAANMLKPALARGEIKCIGATTTAEYRRYIEKDPALERRFQVVWVDEPSKDVAVAIIEGLRGRFEEHYGAEFGKDLDWTYGLPGARVAKALAAWQVNELPGEYYQMLNASGEDIGLLFKAFGLEIPAKIYTNGDIRDLKSSVKPF